MSAIQRFLSGVARRPALRIARFSMLGFGPTPAIVTLSTVTRISNGAVVLRNEQFFAPSFSAGSMGYMPALVRTVPDARHVRIVGSTIVKGN